MTDEPRDGDPTGDTDPVEPAGVPAPAASPSGAADPRNLRDPPPADEQPGDDVRTDGSRTDASAPWERPRRWQRGSLDASRVDALLSRLGNDPDADPTGDQDTRRSRRKNSDGDSVPAGALIAALASSPADPVDPVVAGGSDVPRTGVSATTGTKADQHDDAATESIPRVPADAAALAEAGSIRAALERQHNRTGALSGADPASSDSAAEPPTPAPTDTAKPAVTDTQPPTPADTAAPAVTDTQTPVASDTATPASSDSATPAGTESAQPTAGSDPAQSRTAPGRSGISRFRRGAGATAAAGFPGAAAATMLHGAGLPTGRHRGLLYASRTVAALVALVTLLGVGVEWKIKDRAEVGLQANAVTGALYTDDPSISTARTTPMVVTNSKGVTTTESIPPKAVYPPENILLLGSDTRSGGNAAIGGADSSTNGTSNSDTLMVAHISGDRGHVTILSIPRDTLIPAPHCKSWNSSTGVVSTQDFQVSPGEIFHINSAYAVGGPRCTISAVQSLTGLGINRMIGIDFEGFKAMVDALGGITVNICRPIQDAVLGTVVAKGGTQVIKGAQAISLVRARDVVGDTESDLARIHRQQVVLSAILRQVTRAGTLLNPGKLDGFLQAFVNNTFTLNVKLEDLLTLAGSLGSLDPAHVAFYTLPTVPSTTIDGALDVDKAKAAPVFDDLVNDLPLPGEVPTPAKSKPTATATPPVAASLDLTVAPAKVALELYNLSGRDNVAGMAQQELNSTGFRVGDDQLFTPARVQAATVVQFAPANRAAALTVAAAVPGSTLLVTPGLGDTVRLEIGSSFAGVVKTVAVGQQAPPSLSTAVSTGPSVATTTTAASSTAASTGLSSVNAAAGTCA